MGAPGASEREAAPPGHVAPRPTPRRPGHGAQYACHRCFDSHIVYPITGKWPLLRVAMYGPPSGNKLLNIAWQSWRRIQARRSTCLLRVFYCGLCSADGSSPWSYRGAFIIASTPYSCVGFGDQHRGIVDVVLFVECLVFRQCGLYYLLTYWGDNDTTKTT